MKLRGTLPGLGPGRPAPLRRGGRPSREAAERLGETILDVATELFLTGGYGATSIEALAQRAGISKRTFYHRFPDKAAVFGAVIHRIVEGLRPPATVPLYEGGSIEQILDRLARLMLRAVLSPSALALHRVIVAEAGRFPELAAKVAAEGTRGEVVLRIAALFEREVELGRFRLDNSEFAAEEFIQIVVSLPQRRALGLGQPMSDAELDEWATKAVNLFLNGCRSR